MAHHKAGGSSRNGRDSGGQRLGVKVYGSQHILPGGIIVRQRGTKIDAGQNVKIGKDHTLFSMIEGKVSFRDYRKTNFDGITRRKKIVDVLPVAA